MDQSVTFRKRVYRMGKNSSFIFTCYLKIVPVYNFKLSNMSKNFQNYLLKSKITTFINRVVLADLEISFIHST